ncbi:MAG: flagellar basal body P-ring protein FlgI, partial [Gemmatimonadetes bacterium]|nr:flagellar basal body P-ring protein FlgI [Gemmatimonadota bacterium]
AARVIINERTGTIVAGQFVTISPIAIAHGSLSIRIGNESYVSQPEPLSKGETTTVRDRSVQVTESPGRFVPLDEPANVGELASMLNSLGVSARDLIAIFQALKEAGALRAELRII